MLKSGPNPPWPSKAELEGEDPSLFLGLGHSFGALPAERRQAFFVAARRAHCRLLDRGASVRAPPDEVTGPEAKTWRNALCEKAFPRKRSQEYREKKAAAQSDARKRAKRDGQPLGSRPRNGDPVLKANRKREARSAAKQKVAKAVSAVGKLRAAVSHASDVLRLLPDSPGPWVRAAVLSELRAKLDEFLSASPEWYVLEPVETADAGERFALRISPGYPDPTDLVCIAYYDLAAVGCPMPPPPAACRDIITKRNKTSPLSPRLPSRGTDPPIWPRAGTPK